MILMFGALALSCNSGNQKPTTDKDEHSADSSNSSREKLNEAGADYDRKIGKGSVSDTTTATPGTEAGKGVNSEGNSNNRPIATGTGTEPKKIDTGVKRGKWPTQGDPFS